VNAAPAEALRIGVVALQGAFDLHAEALRDCGADAVLVRLPVDLEGCDGVVLPGGESTTMGKLLVTSGLHEALAGRFASGMAVFGTCAGMILCARTLADDLPNDAEPFGLLDITVRRNAYGRQVESFETDLEVEGLDGGPFRGVFIRAPIVESCGAEVEVLAWQNGQAALLRQGPVLACSFHPELTDDRRIHQLFCDLTAKETR